MPAKVAHTFVNRAPAAKLKKLSRRFKANPDPSLKTTGQAASEIARAAELFEDFHGRPATRVEELEIRQSLPAAVADLGGLTYLDVVIGRNVIRLDFKRSVRATATVDRGSIYFVGGDQELDLKGLKVPISLPKDHARIGEVRSICYFTSKHFHNFEPTKYVHDFGEDDEAAGKEPRRPMLGYDVQAGQIYLIGGAYRVEPEGIVN